MKRMHIHISVDDLQKAIAFYRIMFATEPDKLRDDYARWKLTDPAVTLAISTRGSRQGIDHLGIQVDEENELQTIRNRLEAGKLDTFDEGETVCCYAKSEKSWIEDPAGVPWEVYRTMSDASVFHDASSTSEAACCVPQVADSNCCG